MRNFIKCDVCGKFYNGKDNERYDGVAVFFYGSNAIACTCRKGNIIERNGDDSGVPVNIDMCRDCFDKFVNWAKLCKEDAGEKEEEND